MSAVKELNTGDGKNRFKFQSFRNRLENLSFDVVHQLERRPIDIKKSGSYFREELDKWVDKNSTTNFTNFSTEALKYSNSLAQILYLKAKLSRLIIKHLETDCVSSLEPILNLIPPLARDLQEEFYPHFFEIYPRISSLLNHKDVQVIEWCFNAIAYSFKYLAKLICKDLSSSFKLLSNLLGSPDNKVYLRQFAAESFGFLIRRVKGQELKNIVKKISTHYINNQCHEVLQGSDALLLESMKNVGGRLHSHSQNIIQEVFEALLASGYSLDHQDLEQACPLFNLSQTILTSLCEYSGKENIEPIWKAITNLIDTLSNDLSITVFDDAFIKKVTLVLGVINCYVSQNEGSCVLDYTPIYNFTREISSIFFSTEKINHIPSSALKQLMTLILLLLLQSSSSDVFSKGQELVELLFASKSTRTISEICHALIDHNFSEFVPILMPNLIKIISEDWDSNYTWLTLLLVKVFSSDSFISSNSSLEFLSANRLVLYESDRPIMHMLNALSNVVWKNVFDEFSSLENFQGSKSLKLAQFSNILVILEHSNFLVREALETLQEFLYSLIEFVSNSSSNVNSSSLNVQTVLGEAVIGQAIGTITKISKRLDSVENTQSSFNSKLSKRKKKLGVIALDAHTASSFLVSFWKTHILSDSFKKLYHCKSVLKGISILATALKAYDGLSDVQEIFAFDELKQIYEYLKTPISSHDSQLRTYGFEILSCFNLNGSINQDSDSLFNLCLMIDSIPNELDSYRSKLIHLRKLGMMLSNGGIPHFDETISLLCLGLFSTNFRPIWSDALKTVKLHAHRNRKAVIPIFLGTLESLLDGSYILTHERITNSIVYLNKFQVEISDDSTVLESAKMLFSSKVPHHLTLSRSISQLTNIVSPSTSRWDHWNLADWCFQVLIDSPHLAESQSDRITQLFFKSFQRFSYLFQEHQSCTDLLDILSENSLQPRDISDCDDSEYDAKPLTSQPVYKQMIRFLELLSKFQRPDLVKAREKIEMIFEELLTSSEMPIQKCALKCIETYRYPYLNEYSSHLNGFLSEVGFRDELATFNIGSDSDSIDKAHRSQLLPYIIKVLYGRFKSKKKHKDNSGVQSSKHKAILSYLSKLSTPELSHFIELNIRPFKPITDHSLLTLQNGSNIEIFNLADFSNIPPRMITGFLSLLHDILKQLGYLVEFYFPSLMSIVLHIINHSNSVQSQPGAPVIFKEIRQLSMKRLTDFFTTSAKFNYNPYMQLIFSVAVSPRMQNFAVENSQAPSALLEMFLTWSKHESLVRNLIIHDSRVLPNLYLCLSSSLSKVSVITLVIELIENIFKIDDSLKDSERMDDSPSIMTQLLLPNVSQLLDSLECAMTKSTVEAGAIRDGLFKRQVNILSRLAPFVLNADQASKLLSLLTSSLHKSSKLLDDFTKSDILVIVSELVKIVPELQTITPLFTKYYQSLSRLFFSISFRSSRQALLNIFTTFSKVDPELAVILEILLDLNAFSKRRLDEPDYEKRLSAFTNIHDELAAQLSAHQWLPLLYNFLYFLTDEEEMSLRNSGTFAILKFMDCASQDGEHHESLMELMGHVVFPSIKRGLKFRSETIRSEFVQLLGRATSYFSNQLPYSELAPLLGSSTKEDAEERDDEIEQTNFFSGIYHIQKVRRVKVISRFSAYLNQSQQGKKGVTNSPIRPSMLQNIFLPIFSDLLFSSNDNDISYESIRAIAAISRHFPWPLYYALVRRYLSSLNKKNNKEPIFLKLLLAVLDGFHFEMGSAKPLTSEDDSKGFVSTIHEDESEDDEADPVSKDNISMSIDQIHSVVVRLLIPDLVRLLEKCSEAKIPDRIPIALSITKILKKLPQSSFKKHLPSLLMNVCTLLRSRDITHRDIIRSNLVRIAQLLGPPHLFFIVKELQSTLDRGYMRHILSYTVHALLSTMVPTIRVGEIDHTASRIMEIVVEDMFGETSKEKDAQDYSGKQKETKSRKSPATLELLASIINFQSLGILLSPLKQILHETDTQTTLKRVDEALQRISSGIIKNTKFDSQTLLSFCHGLIQQNITNCQSAKNKPSKGKRSNQQETTFTVHTKRVRLDGTTDYFATNVHKFVEFGLTLFLTSLRKDKFNLEGDEAISFLNPFVDVMGEALYSNYQPIVVLALKNICALIRYPLPSLETALPVMIKRILAIIHQLNATQSDLVQAAFKLLTIVIKDSRLVTISNPELEFLISLIRPDLEEPSRQGTTFALIRAILSRQLLVSALYDLVDDVSTIMITGQTETVRSMCRQVYLQFLLDYPQGAPRVEKQMRLLIANTGYQFETGRVSAMETINVLVNKLSPEILMNYVEMFFLGLVIVLISDDSNKCREMAGTLIKSLFIRMNEKVLETISNLVFRWCSLSTPYEKVQGNNHQLKRTGLQALGLMIDALDNKFLPYLDKSLEHIIDAVKDGHSFLLKAEEQQISLQEQSPDIEVCLFDFATHWEIPYYAIHTFSKLHKAFPSFLTSVPALKLWPMTIKLLLHPHSWIRLSILRLHGNLFAAFDPETLCLKESDDSYSFMSMENLRLLASQHCILEKTPLLDDDLGQQWVKNMFFIGKAFYHNSLNSKEANLVSNRKEAVRNLSKSGESEDSDDENEQDNVLSHENPLGWLFKRCSYLARFEIVKTGVFVRKVYIFQLFAALASIIDPKSLTSFLIPILYPLHRTLKDPVIQIDTSRFSGLVELALEVDEFVKQRVGATSYLEALTSIQETMREKRNRRKDHVAQRAIADPEAYAAARSARNITKKVAKKRRASELAQIPGGHKKLRKTKSSVASKLSGF